MEQSINSIKIGHFNVRSAHDMSDLVTLSKANGYDFLLLSEVNPRFKRLDNSAVAIHSTNTKLSTCIIALNHSIAYKIKTRKEYFVSIALENINLTLSASYIRPLQRGNFGFDQILQGISQCNTPHIIAGDVNARHQSLGDAISNERGTDLITALSIHGWQIMNTHGVYTFDAHLGKSINDWCFHSASMTHRYKWSIDHDFDGMSDHSLCQCIISLDTTLSINTNMYFQTHVSTNRFIKYILQHTKDTDISQWHTHFVNAANAATYQTEIKSRPKFWTPELIRNKNKLNKEKAKLMQLKLPTTATRYVRWREAVTEHRTRLREASIKHWEKLLQSQAQVARQMKKARGQLIETLVDNEELITDGRDVGEAILNHHFPYSPPESFDDLTTDRENDCLFNHHELKRALQSFAEGRCPGEDHITIQTIKIWYSRDPQYLLDLFNFWYAQQTYPDELKDCLILPIKKDKNATNTPSNIRPIGLLMVIGKVYEKLLDSRLRYHLFTNNHISPQQHGFRSGHSTLNALDEINEAAHNDAYHYRTIISWDISGAFNNISQRSIIAALAKTNLHQNTYETIKSYLSNRTVSIIIKGHKTTSPMNKGVVQGSKLSPTLFILALNEILTSVGNYASKLDSNTEFASVTAYADDITVVVGCKNNHLQNFSTINHIMNIITTGLRKIGLNLARHKTQMLHLKRPDLGPTAFIDNTIIAPKYHIKILGIIFDQHLNFNEHLNYAIKKGYTAISSLQIITRRKQRIELSTIKTLIVTVIAPRISYGSSIWLNHSMNQALRPLNRALARAATGCWSTASYCSSIILLPTLPIYWLAEINAKMEEALLNNKYNDYTITRKLDSSKEYHPSIDYSIPITGYIKNQEDMTLITDPLRLFTDGSKYTHNNTTVVGASVIIMQYNTVKFQQRYKLTQETSVFEAEWFAIQQALELISKLPDNQTVHLLSDSLSCLHALASERFTNTTVDMLKRKIFQLKSREINVCLWHSKAHIGIIGNEAADSAAKSAAIDGNAASITIKNSKQIRKLITADIMPLINKEYINHKMGYTIKSFCENIFDRRRALMVINRASAKIYSGHINTLHHLTRMSSYDNAQCQCGETQDIIHILTRCVLLRDNNHIFARKVGLDTNLLGGTWTVLSNTRAFHAYIAERAPSLIHEVETMNRRILDDTYCLRRLAALECKSSVTGEKRRSTGVATSQINSKKQRRLTTFISERRKHNLDISSNSSSETCWPILKKLRTQ